MSTAVAALAVTGAAVGMWWAGRMAETAHRMDVIIASLLAHPVSPDQSASAARDPGAADTGARAVNPPRGAGPTLQTPGACGCLPGGQCRQAPGSTTE